MDGFLLDTCTVSHWYSKNAAVSTRMAALPSGQLYISAITLGEIACGHKSLFATDKPKQVAFRLWLNSTFLERQLPVSVEAAAVYGCFRARLFALFGPRNQKHRPELCVDATGHSLGIDENDLWLVAQASTHKLIFITTDNMYRIKEVVGDDLDVRTWPLVEPASV